MEDIPNLRWTIMVEDMEDRCQDKEECLAVVTCHLLQVINSYHQVASQWVAVACQALVDQCRCRCHLEVVVEANIWQLEVVVVRWDQLAK